MGLLAGIGALAIPGLGPFIAAGPIMAALSGAAAGATAGGVVGGLVGLGIPEYEAKAYEDRIKKGGYLVAVSVEDSKKGDVVRKIWRRNGLENMRQYQKNRSVKLKDCLVEPRGMACKGFVHFLGPRAQPVARRNCILTYCEELIGRDLRGLALSYGASHPKDDAR